MTPTRTHSSASVTTAASIPSPGPGRLPQALQRGMLLTASLLLLSGGGVLAQSGELLPRAERLTPEQQQKVFPDLKRLALEDYSKRSSLLEQARRCVNGARDFDAYRNCRKQERQANNRWRQQQQEALRKMFERNGIAMPERGNPQKNSKKKGGPGGAGEL